MFDREGKKIKVAASVMCFDWKNIGKQLQVLEHEAIDYLHFDLIDGYFAPDYGMGSAIIESIREKCLMRAEFHLMIENPSRIFDALQIKDGDLVTIHQEACKNLHRDIINLKKRGAKVGVALSPATHINTLDYVIEDLDHVLIMTVNPGFKGQNLVERTLRKISELRIHLEDIGLETTLGVDGNVNLENIPRMIRSGANYLVAGSSGMFRKDKKLSDAIQEFRRAVSESGISKV